MNKKIEHALKEYGLSEKDIQVYLATMNETPLSAQQISDKTNLSRQVVYDHLKNLIQEGLVTLSNDGSRKIYQSANPINIISNLKEKMAHVNDIMPDLKEMLGVKRISSTAQIFKGMKGITHLLWMALESREGLLWLTNYKKAHEIFPEYLFHNFTIKRIEKKIPIKQLIGTDKIPKKEENIWLSDKKEYRITKRTRGIDNLSITLIIFENKLIILNMDQTVPQGVLIIDRNIAQGLRLLFMSLWELSIKY